MKLNLIACAAVVVMTSSNVFAAEAQPAVAAPASKTEIISKDEPKAPQIFEELDKNEDGKVSLQEAQVSPALIKGFEKIDSNKDGFLSLDEFSQLQIGATQARRYVVLAAMKAL